MSHRYDREELRRVFDRSSGRCHLCHGDLVFSAYGDTGHRAGWEVDHSKARRRGGSDRLQNLLPAHVACNRAKGAASSRSFRRTKGKRFAPLSVEARKRSRARNAACSAAAGWGLASLACPQLRLLALVVGADVGHGVDPDRVRAWWAE